MTARGNTGVSLRDRINVATYNPAAFKSDALHFSFEFIVKPEIDEFNKAYWYFERYSVDTVELDEENRPILKKIARDTQLSNKFSSPFPLSYFGIGFPEFSGFNLGLSYSLNRAIEYNYFDQQGPAQVAISKSPTYSEYQFTLTANKQFGDFTIGLINILLMPSFKEYRKFDS
jgi:hypothetical protein